MKLKINKNTFSVAYLLLPYFTFAIGFKWPLVGLMVQVLQVVNMLIVGLLIIRSPKTMKKIAQSKFLIPITMFFGILTFSSVYNGQNIQYVIQNIMYGVMPFLIYALYSVKSNGSKYILEGTVEIFAVLIVINLLVMIVYKDGIYSTYSSNVVTKYYLFGAKNQMVAPIMTGMFFFVEYSYRRYNHLSISTIILCIICAAELIIGGSGTGLIMLALFSGLVAFQQKRKKGVNSNATLFIVGIATTAIVVFRLQDIFSFVIEIILRKSITLSNRTYIWDAAFLSIRKHWLIGTGVTSSLSGNVYLELSYISKDTFAHNMFLDFLIMGGILAFVAFLFILWNSKVKYDYSSAVSKHGKTFIWWGIILYLIASIVEIYSGNYCLFIMLAYIASLETMISKQ